MSEWQPIETAPKGIEGKYQSGPRILLADKRGAKIGFFSRHKDGVRGSWHTPSGVFEPTHWMPLPQPPKDEA